MRVSLRVVGERDNLLSALVVRKHGVLNMEMLCHGSRYSLGFGYPHVWCLQTDIVAHVYGCSMACCSLRLNKSGEKADKTVVIIIIIIIIIISFSLWKTKAQMEG